ncbi:hypothetical protein T459_16438 [Capsicum annuum]|uniref:Flavin-containing monooxygenase n=1 Tax=Capsicum annuum TaxID=4072 RepID=A0A2G2Z8Q8_CAPAN|nr:hypothetical protein T459_16438 [Capsicum annuum]
MDYSKMDSATATNFVKGKYVAIVGFPKSGLDIAMECSTVNRVERPCTVVIRTPHWNVPDYFPWGFPMDKLYLNRFSELMVHKPGEGLLLYLMATILSPLCYGIKVGYDGILGPSGGRDGAEIDGSATGPPCGTRIVAGRIVKESYGAKK